LLHAPDLGNSLFDLGCCFGLDAFKLLFGSLQALLRRRRSALFCILKLARLRTSQLRECSLLALELLLVLSEFLLEGGLQRRDLR
jgi:hypothetical protein